MKHYFLQLLFSSMRETFLCHWYIMPQRGEDSFIQYPMYLLQQIRREVTNGPTWKPSVAPRISKDFSSFHILKIESQSPRPLSLAFAVTNISDWPQERKISPQHRVPLKFTFSSLSVMRTIAEDTNEGVPLDSKVKAQPLRLESALLSNLTHELLGTTTEIVLFRRAVSWDLWASPQSLL